MGKVYTLNSTECITSDDVTAKKSNVLAGTKTITSDSDNVIVNGTNDNIPMFVASGIFPPPYKIRPMRLLQFPLLLL